MTSPLLALDFDGVLCDSSPECGIVSANARLALRDPSHAPVFSRAVADAEAFARFLRLRYLVRTADQYLLLWDMLDAGAAIDPARPLPEQTPADPQRLARFQKLFYQLRARWREADYASWLAENPIHPAVDHHLDLLARVPDLHIVSAKDEPSIRGILERRGVPVGPGRVLGRERGDKRELLSGLLAAFPGRTVAFVDDNIENIALAAMPGVRCLLADWGYLGPDWADRARADGHAVLTPDGFGQLLREASQ